MGKNKFKKKPGASLDERRKRIKEAMREIRHEKTGKSTPKAKYTLDQLLDKAQECIDKFEYEMAQKFCQRALEMDPDNVRALETSGSLLTDLGNVEAAKQCFGRAVHLCPDKGYSKYLNLGQLFEGAQSVECFQKGIELMMVEKQSKEAQEVEAACGGGVEGPTDRDVSNAYLSIAEIYMTDCCFDDDAEEKCGANIDKAIAVDPDNPDAHLLRASYLMTQQNTQDAKETIKKSVSLWLPDFQAADQPGASSSSMIECPQSFESRMSTGKILIEVEEYELANEVLETLIEENDECVDVWYLIGWANYLLGDDGKDTARSYLNKAKKLYKKTKCDDADLEKHIDELLEALGTGEDVMDSDAELEEVDDVEALIEQSDDDGEEKEEIESMDQ